MDRVAAFGVAGWWNHAQGWVVGARKPRIGGLDGWRGSFLCDWLFMAGVDDRWRVWLRWVDTLVFESFDYEGPWSHVV